MRFACTCHICLCLLVMSAENLLSSAENGGRKFADAHLVGGGSSLRSHISRYVLSWDSYTFGLNTPATVVPRLIINFMMNDAQKGVYASTLELNQRTRTEIQRCKFRVAVFLNDSD